MSCVSINLIEILRLYWKDEVDKISRSEFKKLDRNTRKNRNPHKRGQKFGRRETGKNQRGANADG